MVALSHAPPAVRACTASSAPASGYRNVYREPGGDGPRFRARVAKRVNIPGRYATEREAARAAAAWLAAFYAELPGTFDRARAVRVMLDHPRRNIGYVRPCGGRYMAFVYVLGEAQVVCRDVFEPRLHPRKWGRSERDADRTWATAAEARAAIKLWLARFRGTFGMFWRESGLWLWR